MAGRPAKEFDRDGLIADWKTGRYKGTAGAELLSKKYGIGKTKVFKVTRDIPQLTNELTNKLVEVNQGLNELTTKEFNSVVNVANRETKLKIRRDNIVNLMFDAIEERLVSKESRAGLSPLDIKILGDASDKNCITGEIADRHNKNAGTTNNIGVSLNTMSLEELELKAAQLRKQLDIIDV